MFWDRVIFIDSVQVPLYNWEKDFLFCGPRVCSQILLVLYPTDSILYRTGVGYQGDNNCGSLCNQVCGFQIELDAKRKRKRERTRIVLMLIVIRYHTVNNIY